MDPPFSPLPLGRKKRQRGEFQSEQIGAPISHSASSACARFCCAYPFGLALAALRRRGGLVLYSSDAVMMMT